MSWKLHGYVVESLLGAGATGEVWAARVAATGERVALKRIPRPGAGQARRAHAEAAMLATLEHPYLIRLHALLPTDDSYVLVLDLADGGSLADLLHRRGRLTCGEVITAVAPVAAAVAYAHQHGVVHGDVSAANVLFTGGGVALLADLGVARLLDDDAEVESTPAYVDPAVAVGCVPAPSSDVFMLGGVALHALTGAPTWDAPTGDAALALARAGDLDGIAERLAAARVPDAMAAVVRRALDAEAHRRGTAAEFALELRHSGTPVAVELRAGRERRRGLRSRTGAATASAAISRPAVFGANKAAARAPAEPVHVPRHAAVPKEVVPLPIGWRQPTESGPLVSAAVNGDPPTQAVGPRPRPVLPRRPPRRRIGPVVAAVAAAVLACAGWAGWRLWPAAAGHPTADSAPRSAADRSPAPADSPTPARTPSVSGPTPASVRLPATPADALATLVALDSVRARAFATRDPGLLRSMYLPGTLLRRDQALLERLVPAGCRLVGMRTAWRVLRVSGAADRVTITARAALTSSRLACAGHAPRAVPGTGPATLQLEVVRAGTGTRIAVLERRG